MSDGGQPPRAADLERNALYNSLDLLGREFIRESEAGRLAGVAKRLLLSAGLNLQHDAVNLIINLLAHTPFPRIFPFLPECKNVVKRVGVAVFRIDRRSEPCEIRELFALGLGKRFRGTGDVVEEGTERTRRRDTRVQLAEGARRCVPRGCEYWLGLLS